MLKSTIWTENSSGLFTHEVKESAVSAAKDVGYEEIRWVECNGVITTHGGPGAFGIVGTVSV